MGWAFRSQVRCAEPSDPPERRLAGEHRGAHGTKTMSKNSTGSDPYLTDRMDLLFRPCYTPRHSSSSCVATFRRFCSLSSLSEQNSPRQDHPAGGFQARGTPACQSRVALRCEAAAYRRRRERKCALWKTQEAVWTA